MINGESYPCALTIGVLKRFYDETGKQIEDVKDIFSICTLLFMAASAACKKDRKLFPWKSAEELMDDIDLADIEPITTGLFGISAQPETTGEKKRD